METFMKDEVLADYWRHQLYGFASVDPIYAIFWRHVSRLPDPARFSSLDTFISRVARICKVEKGLIEFDPRLLDILTHTYMQGGMRRERMEQRKAARKRKKEKENEEMMAIVDFLERFG